MIYLNLNKNSMKIKSIKRVKLQRPIPVYDITVKDKNHNFFLSNGVCVHNCDSDVDGMNIMALLLGALCFLTPNVVKDGRVYIAHCPLFGQYDKKNNFTPVWDQKDLDKNKSTLRFKGLGSMDPIELKRSLLDTATRKLSRVELDDKEKVIKIVGNPEFRKLMFIDEGILCKY